MDGLKLVPWAIYAQVERLMEHGNKMRRAATTTVNATSRRPQGVVTIQLEEV